MNEGSYVYILAHKKNGTLYVGVTRNLVRRVYEHKTHLVAGFTRTYAVDRLVYYERHEVLLDAVTREKQIKKWRRVWKIRLIEEFNPDWRDLYEDICR